MPGHVCKAGNRTQRIIIIIIINMYGRVRVYSVLNNRRLCVNMPQNLSLYGWILRCTHHRYQVKTATYYIVPFVIQRMWFSSTIFSLSKKTAYVGRTDLYYFIQIPYHLFESYFHHVIADKSVTYLQNGGKFCWTVLMDGVWS